MKAAAWGLALFALATAVLAAPQAPLERVGIEYRLYYWPQHEARAKIVAEAAESALPRLRKVLDLPVGQRVDLYLAATGAEFRQLTGGADPNLVLGQAFPAQRKIVLQPLRGDQLARLVVHELMHVLLQDKVAETGAVPPRWLHEGLAKYAAEDFSMADTMLLTEAVNRGKLIPLAELDRAFDGPPEQVSLAYAEAYTLVEFLAREEPAHGLSPFLHHLGQVGDVQRALLRAYNLTPEVFAERWRRYLLSEYLGRSTSDWGLTYIWAAIVGLFLLLFVIRRRRSAAIRRRMEEEEQTRQGMMTMWDWPPPPTGDGQVTGDGPAPGPGEGQPEPEEDSDERDVR